jgi:hypothetical protein
MEHKRIGQDNITWAAEDDETIARMKAGGSSFMDIALALSKGHKTDDVHSWWRHYLKH